MPAKSPQDTCSSVVFFQENIFLLVWVTGDCLHPIFWFLGFAFKFFSSDDSGLSM